MSVYQTFALMIAFGGLLVSGVGVVVSMITLLHKK